MSSELLLIIQPQSADAEMLAQCPEYETSNNGNVMIGPANTR